MSVEYVCAAKQTHKLQMQSEFVPQQHPRTHTHLETPRVETCTHAQKSVDTREAIRARHYVQQTHTLAKSTHTKQHCQRSRTKRGDNRSVHVSTCHLPGEYQCQHLATQSGSTSFQVQNTTQNQIIHTHTIGLASSDNKAQCVLSVIWQQFPLSRLEAPALCALPTC